MKLSGACPADDAIASPEQYFDVAGDHADQCPFLLSSTAEATAAPHEEPRGSLAGHYPTGGDNRAFDIVLALVILAFVAPLIVACSLAIRFSGPGPIFFRQTRIGRGGNEFTCFKFRTMRVDAEAAIAAIVLSSVESREEWLAVQKLTRDPRVTTVGAFLRRYCLDELPQLFNVLTGDMSIVGPRPIVAEEISRYGLNFPAYCSVRPGLTGLWQVSGRHALTYEERVGLDAEYARSKCLRGDLLILWRTVPVVFRGENM